MATADLAEAIKAIPLKKEELRKAFEALQSFSPAIASFTLKWRDLEDHFSSIERSIDLRLKELESKSISATPSPPAAAVVKAEANADGEAEVLSRPELRSLCIKMDGVGLRSYIVENRKDLPMIKNALDAAIRLASDPAKLVLDAMDGFYRPKSEGEKEGNLQAIRRTCLNLLERLRVVAPEIKPSVREKAKELAVEWKGKILDGAENVLAFLQLVASYGLASDFNRDEILDLLISVSRRKQALDLCKSLGVMENMADLIGGLNSKGRQLDAVKFIHALNLMDKYPPVPILKAYLKESKKAAQEVRKKGNNSIKSQNEAIVKELAALKAVIGAIKEYKLESEYSCETLKKRIAQLEQQKAGTKRKATAAVAAVDSSSNAEKQQQYSNKRPRSTIKTPAAESQSCVPLVQNQSQLGLIHNAPYMGSAGLYARPISGDFYGHPGPSISGTHLGLHSGSSVPAASLGLGGNHLRRSYLYPSESLAGSSLYDRPATYGGRPLSPYGSSLYPYDMGMNM
ncbi:truncated FRIGIDA-like protein 1 [Elaeis guineensis]|uniref:FRIGIDA-like protein n=1 Tax=Elaeis guineensis var. tenera TaxID=51953 RepID=A0A6I9S8H0_ELAGV|nr:truncated FRIGIDA-like protein 1 [Elaeis guineensis]